MNPKRFKNTRLFCALGTMAGIGLLTVSTAAQDTCYRVVDLGVLGFTAGIDDIFGINNANQAVFTALVDGEKHAMLYLPVGAYDLAAGVHDLHVLAAAAIPGDESVAHDINSAGIVVGWAEIAGEKHAFVWRLDRDPFEFINLGTFANGAWSEAWAINNESPVPIIVGDGENKDDCDCDPPVGNLDIVRAFWLPLTTPPDDLPTAVQLIQAPEMIVGCDQNTVARDVNTNGIERTTAGYSFFGTPICHVPITCGSTENATVWENPDPMNTTGTALPFFIQDGKSVASGISDLGATVGNGYTATNVPCLQHAFYWHSDVGPLVDLGSATGVDPNAQTLAVRINNNQPAQTVQAVGWDLSGHGLLWECDGACDLLASWSATDLNGSVLGQCGFSPPEWLILKLFDVNDNGWIIGVGASSGQHAVLLAPLENCPPAQCLGDIDGNGVVGATDLLALLVAWGPCPAPPAACDADLDCNGSVGASDLLILLTNWGPCGSLPGSPPEDIMDCIDRFCCAPEDLLALEKCICLVDPECDP